MLIFWIAKKHVLGAQNGQNHSGGKARERQKINKNATLFPYWCFLVLEGAFGYDFHRFSGGVWHELWNFRLDLELFFYACRSVFVTFPCPKNLRSIAFASHRKAFRSWVFAHPWHQICNHSHNPSAALLFEGRRFRGASTIVISILRKAGP